MKVTHPLSVLLLLPFLLFAPNLPAQSDWELHKEKDGVQVFFREAPGTNIKELMMRTRIQAPLASLVALLSDPDNYGNWMDHCREVKKLKTLSPTDYIYYHRSNFPWPLADREFIMKSHISQDPNTFTVTFRSEADPDYLPPADQYVRVRETLSGWKITPVPGGYLDLEYRLKTDPGGSIPAWMVNMALKSQPFKTIEKITEMAQSEAYRNVHVSFIREPAKSSMSSAQK